MEVYISIINLKTWDIFNNTNINTVNTFIANKSMRKGYKILFYISGNSK
ncbi:hypothetical protein [[Clostridium] colinum]|nr:hypothetical protein [[Clostridium] colinum]